MPRAALLRCTEPPETEMSEPPFNLSLFRLRAAMDRRLDRLLRFLSTPPTPAQLAELAEQRRKWLEKGIDFSKEGEPMTYPPPSEEFPEEPWNAP